MIFNTWYEGHNYVLKKSFMLIIGRCFYNEDDYPDPSAFKLERFMKDGQLDQKIRDPAMISKFGNWNVWGK